MSAIATLPADVSIPLGEDYPDIRENVRRICAGFPGAYWRDLEAADAYPSAFVQALTDAGYLAALIPEESRRRVPAPARGLRHPRGDPRRGLQRGRVPRADVHHRHAPAARQ